MAREIINWCDVCFAKGDRTPGRSVRVALDDARPVELDLCETDEQQLIGTLRELVAAHGQPVIDESRAAREKPHICPACSKGYSSARMLERHIEQKHSELSPSGSSSSDESGQLQLATGDDDTTEKTFDCPECEQTFETSQGRGAHRARAHGYVSPTKADRDAAKRSKGSKRRESEAVA